MKRIVIFASGSGSNAERITDYFKGREDVEVSLILTNNENAGVIDRAKRLKVPFLVFGREHLYKKDTVKKILRSFEPDIIVLAGFLRKFPSEIISEFSGKVINIHPALLPKYGGKGMYGMNVHEAVVEHGEKESGITIHYVNENYDEGNIIAQYKTKVEATDDAHEVAMKIHKLEYQYFPVIIEKILDGKI